MTDNILKNKNCLITGATGGLGKEIAIEFAKKGCNIFLTGRNRTKLENLKSEIQKIDNVISIEYQLTDLRKDTELNLLISTIRQKFKQIHILCHTFTLF